MGLTHLHEHVEDEMRGRVFATLFGLMRIGLFLSMGAAVPLAGAINISGIGRLNDPNRLVLFIGGGIMLLSGAGLLWSLRTLFARPKLESATHDLIAHADKARRASTQRKAAPKPPPPTEPPDEE
jgi:hypothetical protein